MAQSTLLWNLIAKRYAKTPVANEEAYLKKLEITRNYLDLDTKLFEFGCGTGTTAVIHAPKVKSVLAIDIAEKMLEIARSKASDADTENIEFQKGAIEDFQGEPESFDVVLGMSILHIVENKELVVRKVNRLLKPGGVFISSTVCLDNVGNAWKFALNVFGALRILPAVQFLGEGEIISTIKREGFEIEHRWRPTNNEALFVVARKEKECS